MLIDATTLADAKQEADDLWARRSVAEDLAKKTPEALRVKELEEHWHIARKRVEAMELLLSTEPKEVEI